MRLTPALLLAAFAACSISEAKIPNEIGVELASVTLAEDCPGIPAPPPPPAQPPTKFAKPPPAASSQKRAPGAARGDCAGTGCGPARRACEQTSMQLAFNAQAGVRPTKVKIKRVELLDTKGKVLEVLTASTARQWSQTTSTYVAWDEALGPNSVVRATYNLKSPDWNKLTNGRMNAHTHTFQLRVVVEIGNSERTVEKTAVTPARIAPVVVT